MDYRLLCLAVGTFTISTVGFAFSGLLPLIAADTHVAVAEAGLVITAYSLAYAIGAPVLSAVAGTFERRHLLCAAMLAFVVGNLVAAASPVFGTLIGAQLVMGASAGLFVATAQATAVSLVEPHHRARAVSLVFTGTTFAVALGAPLGSLIASLWGWRETFVCVAVLGLACVAVIWLWLPRDMRGSKLSLRERLDAIGRPGIASALMVTLFYLAGGFVIIGYFAPLAMDGAGLSELVLPAILLSFGLGAVIGNLASGYLADRIGATRVIAITLIVSIAFSITISLGLKWLPAAVAGPALIGVMFPWGVIGWAFPPAQASRLAGFAPDAAHLTLSLNVSALYFGIALGTLVGGRVLEYAEASDLGFAAAIFPIAALAVLAIGERRLAGSAAE
jgi:DHA1 family inner membrane transport protein